MSDTRRSTAKRPPVEWGIRWILALAAALIGAWSLFGTLANVIVKVDPARAHTLAPWNGRIVAADALQRYSLNLQSAENSDTARLARLALRQDPTAVQALSVLGLQAQLRNDTEQARRVFSYALALSRRELRSQIWAIEEAVARGDIAGALRQHDIALRTSESARDLLFPVLASSVAEPRVRAMLIRTLAAGAEWGPPFIHYLAATALAPEATVQFFHEGERANLAIQDFQRAALINTLVARGLFDDAWDFYASFRSGADRRRSRDLASFLPIEAATLFDWTLADSPGLFASLQQDERGGLIDFAASPSAGGTLLRQLQMLPPGTYRLAGRSTGIEQPDRSLPYWSLKCRDAQELGRVIVPKSSEDGGAFAGRFTVPSGCPVQTLSLVIRPSDEIGGVTGQIDQVRLAPAR